MKPLRARTLCAFCAEFRLQVGEIYSLIFSLMEVSWSARQDCGSNPVY